MFQNSQNISGFPQKRLIYAPTFEKKSYLCTIKLIEYDTIDIG